MNAPVYTFRDARLRSPLLQSLNVVGKSLGAIGLKLPSLDAKRIIAAALEKSATTSQPSHDITEALERYVDSAEADSRLNTMGRVAVKNMLVGALQARFSVIKWHQQKPELEHEQIRQPWIVIGLPRTGTSILSILLGLDPMNRPLQQWEARYPIPPPGLAGASEDPRIAALSRQHRQLQKLNPAVATMHPFGSTLAEECTALFTYSLRTIGMETIAFTPSYGKWLDDADMAPAYAIHRQTLQALQRAQPTGHWVLKSPNHLWCLPALLAAYPDARIIWTHRDPAKVLPSLASLNCAMQMQFTRQLEPERVGNYWADKIERAITRAALFDSERQPGWCYHLQYKEFIADPASALATIYANFDVPMNELHAQRISAWLSQRPQHADGVHAYDPADFGWSNGSLQQRFSQYQQRYAVPIEG